MMNGWVDGPKDKKTDRHIIGMTFTALWSFKSRKQ